MNPRTDREMLSDEMLVAFLDGELDASDRDRIEAAIRSDDAVAERLNLLSRSNLPFRAAFEPLLAAAPADRLNAMLAEIPSAASLERRQGGFSRRGFLSAAAACLVAGIAIDRAAIAVRHRLTRPDEGSEWRATVAEYMALYTADTLSVPSGGEAGQAMQLAEVGAAFDLELTPKTVSLPGADFRRAQLLQYDGAPLAQIAYLDADGRPMALCLVRSDDGTAGPAVERRRGMNVVYWSSAAHAFMLIGHGDQERLKALADTARERLA